VRIDQFDRYVQYLFRFIKHSTVTKVANLIKIESRLLRNNPNIEGCFPHFLYVEISNKCNLFCPLCQMGLRQTVPRPNTMNLDNYSKIIEPLKDYLFQVFLYDWGEPFLNNSIYDIISYNTRNNIGSMVSSNLNIPIDAERLIESGLEYLIISGDGVTQDVYSTYRKGGDIEKVFANLNSLIEVKRKKNTRYPIIEWQCLVMKHNERHLRDIKRTVLQKGVDRVRFANVNFYSTGDSTSLEQKWLPENRLYRSFASERSRKRRERGIRKPCFFLWRTGVVNVNGGVTPCCLYDVPDWGNALDESFMTVWNNPLYREARLRSQNNQALKKQNIICDTCTAPFIY